MVLYRAQVLLDGAQRENLQRLAEESGRSMSELLRDILADYFEHESRKELIRQSLDAVDRLEKIRRQVEGITGVLESSFLEEVRDERDVDIASR